MHFFPLTRYLEIFLPAFAVSDADGRECKFAVAASALSVSASANIAWQQLKHAFVSLGDFSTSCALHLRMC